MYYDKWSFKNNIGVIKTGHIGQAIILSLLEKIILKKRYNYYIMVLFLHSVIYITI